MLPGLSTSQSIPLPMLGILLVKLPCTKMLPQLLLCYSQLEWFAVGGGIATFIMPLLLEVVLSNLVTLKDLRTDCQLQENQSLSSIPNLPGASNYSFFSRVFVTMRRQTCDPSTHLSLSHIQQAKAFPSILCCSLSCVEPQSLPFLSRWLSPQHQSLPVLNNCRDEQPFSRDSFTPGRCFQCYTPGC